MMILSMIRILKGCQQKLESVQYNAALAIIGTMRGTSREKIYSELQSWS